MKCTHNVDFILDWSRRSFPTSSISSAAIHDKSALPPLSSSYSRSNRLPAGYERLLTNPLNLLLAPVFPMHIAVEISLYPLDANYIPSIKDFIDRLTRYPEIRVVTNAMSTQISGEHARVFEVLAKETAQTFAEQGRRVFVMKVLGGEA